ncbi:hypothetical protein K1T71_011084 [Dendrolimus kikuchii]|uniref:Uncharacterized protein n=1 Tax=Dendrolimus kikuchii TaxID=765133 RepID=A0ACC1CMS8_9NEOP|nr:hypothetical protein K1T71_011084 [Dendrolimus kikuchii]
MELNRTFFTGLGCGICLGISLFACRKYLGCSKTQKTVKAFASNEEYKLVLVVRADLQMTKGKIAAQCGHASVDAFEKAQKIDPVGLNSWMSVGQTKVAVKTNSLEELKLIEQNARNEGINTSMFVDCGRTQIAPDTITVLGVGPAPRDLVDKVTGHLKLL